MYGLLDYLSEDASGKFWIGAVSLACVRKGLRQAGKNGTWTIGILGVRVTGPGHGAGMGKSSGKFGV